MPNLAATSAASTKTKPAVVRRLTGVQILATGGFAPDDVVSNEQLAEHGYDSEWIFQRTGIRERRRAPAGMATSDMAYEASVECLEQAGVDAEEVDLILLATMTPDTHMPSAACRLQQRLGSSAAAMDLNAACAGFAYALVTGMQFIATGCNRRVLVVGADLMTRFLNPADKKTFPLFGDGAGAVLLGAGDGDQGLLSYTIGADGSGAELLTLPGCGSREPATPETLAAGKQYVHMDGRPVFKWAVRIIANSILDVLEAAQLNSADIDLFVLHQANIRIMDSAIDNLGIDPKKVFVNVDRYGNTSAGSIPLALSEADREGLIQRGDHIVVCGFGAGLTWGTAVLKW
jgi:3-oxoacyl-[acyl-carrier-protein] synthase-3